jgi:hypothetical protein
MKPIKNTAKILHSLIASREENIQKLLTFSDDYLKELKQNLLHAKDLAIEESLFGSVEILEERISQLHEVKERKYSLSEDASDWIHW